MLLHFSPFLDRYSVRPAAPDLAHLQQIARAFSHLPYENVTKILKDARSSNVEAKLRLADEVLEDHLRWSTGGTCFSLCNALQCVLHQAGFASFIAMADMHSGANIHCAVVVRLQNTEYLLDPGYLLHDPISLPEHGHQVMRQTQMNTVFLRSEEAGVLSLYTHENGQLKWRYRLRAWPVPHAEFLQHWIRSFSLNTMEHILLSRVTESGRLYFRKDRLEQVQPAARIKKKIPGSEVRDLWELFGVPSDLILQAQKALLSRL